MIARWEIEKARKLTTNQIKNFIWGGNYVRNAGTWMYQRGRAAVRPERKRRR